MDAKKKIKLITEFESIISEFDRQIFYPSTNTLSFKAIIETGPLTDFRFHYYLNNDSFEKSRNEYINNYFCKINKMIDTQKEMDLNDYE